MKQPHSPATDGCSVGVTINDILENTRQILESKRCHPDSRDQLAAVKMVVLGLTRESHTGRMTIEEAQSRLKMCIDSNKRHHKKQRNEDNDPAVASLLVKETKM